MFSQVSHIVIDIELCSSFIDVIFNLSDKLLINLLKLNKILNLFAIFLGCSDGTNFLFYDFFMFYIFLSYVMKKVTEKSMIVYY